MNSPLLRHPCLKLPPRLFALVVLPTLAGCGGGVLDPQGPIGADEKTILLNSLGIMLFVVVPTILLTIGVAWWYRASNTRARYTPDWEYSGKIEMVVWAIPMMVVLALAGVTWIGSHDLDPPAPIASRNKAIVVDVVALDWKWLFIYPDQGVASVNLLPVPVNTPVTFHITSSGPMNAFWVPQLGSMIYAMAGMRTTVNLEAAHLGSFPGGSAQYSGDGFNDMAFSVKSLSAPDFAAWVTEAKKSGTLLDTAAYAQLVKQSEQVKPYTYSGVDPALFDNIVNVAAPQEPPLDMTKITVNPATPGAPAIPAAPAKGAK